MTNTQPNGHPSIQIVSLFSPIFRNMQFQSKHFHHLKNFSQVKRLFAVFQIREEPNSDTTKSGTVRLSKVQTLSAITDSIRYVFYTRNFHSSNIIFPNGNINKFWVRKKKIFPNGNIFFAIKNLQSMS